MRIGITCYPTEGGSGVVATELGKDLARRGHEVHFITSSLPVRLRTFEKNICFHEVRPENYPVFHYPPYSLSLAAKMAEVATNHDLDVLHAHYAMPHAASAYLAKQMLRDRGVKTMTTLHGTDITLVGQAPSFFAVTQFSIQESDCVTSVSQWLKDETIRIFNPRRSIRVIPNFVDVQAFRPRDLSDRRSQFATSHEKIILHISNFRPVKNLPAVVAVFDRVRRELPARLLLVGDGPERISVETLVRDRGLADGVTFLGNQEYVEDLFPHADVFLLPSLHESFGLAALEAMAVGVPVVATDVGGPNEVVVDGECGFLRSPRDVPGMVEAVLRILTEPGLGRAMGEAGVRRVHENFTLDRIVPQYLEAYASACG
jgi:N-acetyl-alpha-D-glucosaminyl L-malate synthase BshA